MTAPSLRPVDPGVGPYLPDEPRPPRWWRRAAARAAAGSRSARDRLAGPARMLPGLAAAGCACAGSFLLWGLGVALLVAAGLLLLVDARTPAP